MKDPLSRLAEVRQAISALREEELALIGKIHEAVGYTTPRVAPPSTKIGGTSLQRLADYVAERANGFGAAEAATDLSMPPNTVNATIHRLLSLGLIRRVRHGFYVSTKLEAGHEHERTGRDEFQAEPALETLGQ